MIKKKPSILVIEDNEGHRKTLLDILSFRGYETFVAETGEEGLILLRKRIFNLVVTDLGLPDISGIKVLERIKIINPSIQVIILTGSSTFDSAMEATNLGAFSYLLKPYDIAQLLLHIQRAIEKQTVEENLRLSQKMLEEVTQGITESIMLISRDYRVLWANRTALEQVGLTGEEIVGKYCYAVNHHQKAPCESPDYPCPIREFLSSGNSKTVLHVSYDIAGNKKTGEVNAYMVQNGGSGDVEFVYVYRDVTERVKLEQAITDKVAQLELSLARVNQLEGILPICMYCKKIRDAKNNWNQIEAYISKNSQADFSHGICPECFKKYVEESE